MTLAVGRYDSPLGQLAVATVGDCVVGAVGAVVEQATSARVARMPAARCFVWAIVEILRRRSIVGNPRPI